MNRFSLGRQVLTRTAGHYSQFPVGMDAGRGPGDLVVSLPLGSPLPAQVARPCRLLQLQICGDDCQCGARAVGRKLCVLWCAGLYCLGHFLLPGEFITRAMHAVLEERGCGHCLLPGEFMLRAQWAIVLEEKGPTSW